MLSFIDHPCFNKEAAVLQRRLPKFIDGLKSFKRICEVHFNPTEPRQVIAPGKLHRIKVLDNYTIWKIELAVANLRPNQFPRIWFAIQGSTIVFLCSGAHMDNYNDEERDRVAEQLVTDIF